MAVGAEAAHSAARPAGLPARLRGQFGWLTPADRAVLRIWLVSRVAVLALSWPAAWILQSSKAAKPWMSLWQSWDAGALQAIAQYGYFGPVGHSSPNYVAYFPGYPIMLTFAHLLLRQWVVSELLISFVAGAVAVVALGRIADLDYSPRSGSRAVLYLVAAPAAIFLAVGYTESLFLAFALPSWLCARKGRWQLAVVLAGAASLVRVNGLILCAALVIEILRNAGRLRLRALATFVPALAPLAGYELYLRLQTGDWLAWAHAEGRGWQRQLTNPVDAFRTTWTAAFGREFTAPVGFVFQLEILAVLIGVVTTLVLLWAHRWPEAVYAGLTIVALATSVWYESVPRALLLIWPLWCGLAAISARWRLAGQLWLAVSIPLSVSVALLYLTGHWAG